MENISVYICLKPANDQSESHFSYDSKTITNSKTKEIISFDSILTPSMSNKDIFEKIIKQNIASLLKGINISIMTYGQTGSGKTFIMKGDQINNEGFITLSIKEVFNSLNNKDTCISKYTVKISYLEIYNENVNDLIDNSKKNLEIKESSNKRIYVNNLSEISVSNVEKALQIYNKGETNRINGEAKLNEKSNRNNIIFRITVEFLLKDKKSNKDKKYYSHLNLIELAGSENACKTKNEGVRNKEIGNMNKSLLTFTNLINKLSQNNKFFINYKESKLTRLLQSSIGGNSKTSIICTIIDDNIHYSENVNTLHFAIKARNIKNAVKFNEINNDKRKKISENQALRNKIKMLEKIINDKKSLKDKENNNKCDMSGNDAYSTIGSGNKDIQNNEQILNLEKEVSLLKKYLMNNEEMEIDFLNVIQEEEDWMNLQTDNEIFNMNTSAYKPSFHQTIGNLSAIRGSESAIKNTFFNSPNLLRQQPQIEFNNSNLNHLEGFNNKNFRKNICMTEMRSVPCENKNFFHSAIRYTAPHNNNFMYGSNVKFPMPDLGNLSSLNNTNFDIGNNYLEKENEELKKNIYELKKTYNEIVQSKEEQIKLLNQNHDITLENCEKLIKEAETNYINLKSEYDHIIEEIKNKDNELDDLKQKSINQDTSINFYKKELNKVNDFNYASEMEAKCNSLLDENTKLKQKEEEETTRLKEENDLLKKNIDMIDNKYKEKCKELNDNQKMINETKKKHEKELKKYKIEIKNYKNIIPKMKNLSSNNNQNNLDSGKIKEYEDKINQLIKENNEYKNNLEKIEKTQIAEYQKLLDDSFAKIAQLNKELIDFKDKNKYLEKALNIIENNSVKNEKGINLGLINNNMIELKEEDCNQNKTIIQNKKIQSTRRNINNYSSERNSKNNLDDENKNYLNKKRKGLYKMSNKQHINSINQMENKENNNILNTEFSNFEI